MGIVLEQAYANAITQHGGVPMRIVFAILLAAAVVLVAAWPGAADSGGEPNENAEYGQHVREHVQEMGGFTGEMNPGVHHQGKSGWEEHHSDGHEH